MKMERWRYFVARDPVSPFESQSDGENAPPPKRGESRVLERRRSVDRTPSPEETTHLAPHDVTRHCANCPGGTYTRCRFPGRSSPAARASGRLLIGGLLICGAAATAPGKAGRGGGPPAMKAPPSRCGDACACCAIGPPGECHDDVVAGDWMGVVSYFTLAAGPMVPPMLSGGGAAYPGVETGCGAWRAPPPPPPISSSPSAAGGFLRRYGRCFFKMRIIPSFVNGLAKTSFMPGARSALRQILQSVGGRGGPAYPIGNRY